MTSKQIEMIQDYKLIPEPIDEKLEAMFAEKNAVAEKYIRLHGVPYFDANGNIIGARFPPEVEGGKEIIKLYPQKKKADTTINVKKVKKQKVVTIL